MELLPINNTERVVLDDLVGYEIQKKKLVDNTEAFVRGLPANNVLLLSLIHILCPFWIKITSSSTFSISAIRCVEISTDAFSL